MNIKYKIIVRGGYGLTNFGDDALLKSIHEDYLDGYSKDELSYSSTQAEYLKKDIGNYTSLPLEVKYADLTKILIFGGGTQFYSFSKKKSLFFRIFSKLYLLLRPKSLIKIIRGKLIINQINGLNNNDLKIIALGIGLGPFLKGSDPKIELRTKSLFQNIDFVAVRDQYSYLKCQEWGVKNFERYSDLCFKMKHEKFFPKDPNNSLNKIGVIVRDWNKTKEGNSYQDNLINTVRLLRNEGKDIQFIVFSKNKDLNWLKLLNIEKENFLQWDPYNYSIDEFFNILSKFDLFITSRYHGAVFSSMLGKPFITIEVENKLNMICELFSPGSDNWAYPFEVDDLIEKFHNIESNYVQYSLNIVKKALIQHDLAIKMKTDLDLQINNSLNL